MALVHDEAKRVLHIVSTMDRGGAETLIMNIYRNIDRQKYQFDFITHSPQKCDFEDEILQLGGKIFKIPSLGQLGPFLYIKELRKIMSYHPYEAVHIHTDFQGGFPAIAAKLSGIKRRICHSHSNNWPRGDGLIGRNLLKVFQTLIRFSASEFCSCSTEAAQFLFGEKLVHTPKVKVLNNGIDLNQFKDVEVESRNHFLDEIKVPGNAKILGHVGTFSKSKNQSFILKVLKKLLDHDDHFYAIFVGDGPLKNQVEEEAVKLGVIDHVRFLGVRSDIPKLMHHFDVFMFPSFFEGFGIVTIEAQSCGTPCVVSDAVPKSTDMDLGLVSFVNLNDSLEKWYEKIKEALLKQRPDKVSAAEKISKRGFSIQSNVEHWLKLYGTS